MNTPTLTCGVSHSQPVRARIRASDITILRAGLSQGQQVGQRGENAAPLNRLLDLGLMDRRANGNIYEWWTTNAGRSMVTP